MSPRRAKPPALARKPGLPVQQIPRVRFELRCGAVLFVSPRPGAPIFSIHAHVRGGPSLDLPGLEGTAYLTGGLADQGTRKHDETAIAGMLESAGGEITGESGGLCGTVVSPQWKLLLRLLSEILITPTFPAAEVRRQKERLLQRLHVEAADPRQRGALAFRRLVYGDHWLGRPAYGTIESIESIEPRHLRAYHRRNWVACRGVIAVCGDVDPEEVRRYLDRQLSSWNPGKPLAPKEPVLPEPRVAVEVVRAKRQQVHLYLGHLGIRRNDPDYPALVVLDHILGQGPGFSDRISRRLRDELGLAYSVSASISSSAGLLPGTFTAYIGTSPQHVTTALQGFLTEIRRIQDELVPHDELQVVKDYLVGAYSIGFERASRRSGYLVTSEVHQLPEDELQRLPRLFKAVTPEDLQRAAQRHLFPDRCCVTASGPVTAKELKAALAGG